MCFSTEISFGAAAVLGAAAVASLSKVTHRNQILFASIPLVFAVQQACEGVLWLSLTHPALVKWQNLFTYLFLFFAQLLWTTWLPLSFLLPETRPRARRLLRLTLAAGIAASLLLGYRLLVYGARAEVDCNHIFYGILSPDWIGAFSSLLYIAAVILPPFISKLKYTSWLGLLLTISLIITKLFYDHYLISVWCFFGALLSVFIIYVMRQFHFRPSHKGIKELRHQH
jgi:hypothetical protein